MKDVIVQWIFELVEGTFCESISSKTLTTLFEKNYVKTILESFIYTTNTNVIYFSVDKESGNPNLFTTCSKLSQNSEHDSICIYILKKRNQLFSLSQINPNQFTSGLHHGIFTFHNISLMSQLKMMAEDIFLKFSLQLESDQQITEQTFNTVIMTVNEFTSDLYQMNGQIVEKITCLPLPSFLFVSRISMMHINSRLDGKSQYDPIREVEICNANYGQYIEKYIIIWMDQITQILQMSIEKFCNQTKKKSLEPKDELKFWYWKKSELNHIYHQLQVERVRKILQFLDRSKNKFNAPFANLCREVFCDLNEANHNCKVLQVLQPYIDELYKENDFTALAKHFRPILHILLLLLNSSTYYKAKIVQLLSNLSNWIVEQSHKHCSCSSILKMLRAEDCQQVLQKITEIIHVYEDFKSIFSKYQQKSSVLCPNRSWNDISDKITFSHMQSSLNRCHEILDLVKIKMEYDCIQGVIFSGNRGTILTSFTKHIYHTFQQRFSQLFTISNEMSIVEVKKDGKFESFYYSIRRFTWNLDRQLAEIIIFGLGNCSTLLQKLSLLKNLRIIIKRQLIRDVLKAHFNETINTLCLSIKNMSIDQQYTFNDTNVNSHMINYFIHQMKFARIHMHIQLVEDIDSNILQDENVAKLMSVYNSFRIKMEKYFNKCTDMILASLRKAQIHECRNSSILIAFDDRERLSYPACLHINNAMCMESLYKQIQFTIQNQINLPNSLRDVHKFITDSRVHIQKLKMFCSHRNEVINRSGIEKIIYTTFEQNMALNASSPRVHYNPLSHKPHKAKSWTLNELKDFADDCMQTMEYTSHRTHELRIRILEMEECIISWKQTALFKRPSHTYSSEGFIKYLEENKEKFRMNFNEGIDKVQKLLINIFEIFPISIKIKPRILQYMNMKIVLVLEEIVAISLKELEMSLNPDVIQQHKNNPMIIIELHLEDRKAYFDLKNKRSDSTYLSCRTFFQHIMNQLIGIKLRRLNECNEYESGTYIQDLLSSPRILYYISTIEKHVDYIDTNIAEYQKRIWNFKELWMNNHKKLFNNFLLAAHPNANVKNELSAKGNKNHKKLYDTLLDDVRRLKLPLFDVAIKKYISHLNRLFSIQSWIIIRSLKINIKPWKETLEPIVAKATTLYTSYLQSKAYELSYALQVFLDDLTDNLKDESSQINSTDLKWLKMMKEQIHIVQSNIDKVPMSINLVSNIIDMLQTYEIKNIIFIGKLPILNFLQETLMLWNKTVTNAFRAKQSIQSIL